MLTLIGIPLFLSEFSIPATRSLLRTLPLVSSPTSRAPSFLPPVANGSLSHYWLYVRWAIHSARSHSLATKLEEYLLLGSALGSVS